MTDAKPAYDSSAEFERACNALLLEVDVTIVDDIRARGRAAIGAEAARVKALEDALRSLLDGCIALDGEEAILPMQMSKARAALKEPSNG